MIANSTSLNRIWIVADEFPKLGDKSPDWEVGMQEWESKDSIDLLASTVQELEYIVQIIYSPKDLLDKLANLSKEERSLLTVWNLVEGIGSRNRESYIPGICEYFGINCIGSDSYAQIISLDKNLTSTVSRTLGIPVANEIKIDAFTELQDLQSLSGVEKYFVKPNGEGSSIGIYESSIQNSFEEAIVLSEKMRSQFPNLLIQEFLPGEEYTVCLLQEDFEKWKIASAQVIPPNQIYGSDIKVKDSMPEKIEFRIDKKIKNEIEKMSLKLIQHLTAEGYARVDWKIDFFGKPKLLECNLTPGLSKIYSLFPKIFDQGVGINYKNLIDKMITVSNINYKQKSRYHYGKKFF